MDRRYRNKEWLSEKYLEEGHSTTDIAGEFGVETSTITYWLQKHGISKPDDKSNGKCYNDIDWLTKKYLGEGLTCKEISELPECDVGESSIQNRISKYEIAESSKRDTYVRISIERGSSPDSKHLDPGWMYEKYVEQKKTAREISSYQSVDVSPSSVNRALHAFGIDTRPSLSVEGEDNPWYKDGNSYREYGDEWDEIRTNIRERDDYICQQCNISQREHLQLFDMRLDVHHITPLSKFDTIDKANSPDNLVTLCRSCHRKIETGSTKLEG